MSVVEWSVAAVLAASAAAMAGAPTAAGEPVWPVAGAESARATINDLQAQGYNVAINWVAGSRRVPLSLCSVTGINNPDRSPGPDPTVTTVYVDVSCPSDDSDWSGGIWFGLGAG